MFHTSKTGIGTGAARMAAPLVESTAREGRTDFEVMQHDIERLLMITEALWNFLKQEHGYTDETLGQMISKIDMRDGKLDGRVGRDAPNPCPSCGKPNSARRPFCIYCGNALPVSPFAR